MNGFEGWSLTWVPEPETEIYIPHWPVFPEWMIIHYQKWLSQTRFKAPVEEEEEIPESIELDPALYSYAGYIDGEELHQIR